MIPIYTLQNGLESWTTRNSVFTDLVITHNDFVYRYSMDWFSQRMIADMLVDCIMDQLREQIENDGTR